MWRGTAREVITVYVGTQGTDSATGMIDTVRHVPVLTARGRAALREARRFHLQVEKDLVKSVGARQVANAREVLLAFAAERAAEPLTWGEDRPF